MIITDAEKVSRADPLDILLMATQYGTKGIFAEDFARSVLQLAGQDSEAGNGSAKEAYFALLDGVADVSMRKTTFRGKNLGDEVTEEQYAAIADGSFKGLFCGDYWRINGHTWRIADFDYYYFAKAYSKALGTMRIAEVHHLVIFPDEILIKCALNSTDTTASGILGSNFYGSEISVIGGTNIAEHVLNTIIYPVFSETYILGVQEWMSNLVTDGVVNGGSNIVAKIQLPTEPMIIGTRNFSSMSSKNSMSMLYTCAYNQLALLKLRPEFINKDRTFYWFRDVANDSRFLSMGDDRMSNHLNASNPNVGIRPIIVVCGIPNW